MRNYLFIATMVIGMLASCSKGSDRDRPEPNGPDTEDSPVEVLFSVGAPQTAVVSKSTGTVGDMETGTNKWNEQKLFIYGFDRSVADYSSNPLFIENVEAKAPASDANKNTLSWAETDKHFFYEGNTIYDFYGYHIDDANALAGQQGGTAVPVKTADKISVRFKIDGSQDLMIAKAALTTEQEAKLPDNTNKAYSAYAARRGVHPSMTFEHLLSRLQFFIYPGSTNAGNVEVTGIEIKSQVSGELVVVHKTDANRGITGLDDHEAEVISLKQRNPQGEMESLAAVSPADFKLGGTGTVFENQTAKQVGESLMPIPANEYKLTVKMSETVIGGNTAHTSSYTTTIKAPIPATAFEAGKSYKINIVIYSLEEIVITTELKPWEDGGKVDVDPDKEIENPTPNPVP